MAIPVLLNNATAFAPTPGILPGVLWNWGLNDQYQIGNNSTTFQDLPTALAGHQFVKVVSVSRNTIALKADNTVWVWGGNWGNNGGNIGVYSSGATQIKVPTQVPGVLFQDISQSVWGAVGIDMTGHLYAVGYNTNSQFTGALGALLNTFTLMEPTETFTKCEIGSDPFNVHGTYNLVCALKANGEIWGCGSSSFNQTNGTSLSKLSTGSDIYTAISTDGLTVIGLRNDGVICGRGYGGNGELGNGLGGNSSTFTANSSGQVFTQALIGSRFVVGLANDGSVWGWGNNNTSVLGSSVTPNTPVKIQNGSYDYIGITKSDGDSTAFGLKSDGSLEAWGSNNNKEFGNGTASPATSTTPVAAGNGELFDRIPEYANVQYGSGIKV